MNFHEKYNVRRQVYCSFIIFIFFSISFDVVGRLFCYVHVRRSHLQYCIFFYVPFNIYFNFFYIFKLLYTLYDCLKPATVFLPFRQSLFCYFSFLFVFSSQPFFLFSAQICIKFMYERERTLSLMATVLNCWMLA